MLNSIQGMTIKQVERRAGAFTLIELLCVLAIIGVLAALLLPALSKASAQAKRVQCVNHLRQTGIGFQNFAQDHNGQFPMSVPVSAGGSLEFARNAYGISGEFYFAFRHFQVLSNELITPKVVICPADTRQAAANFAVLGNRFVSYFVGISAVPASPDSILAGDRNLTNDWSKPATLLRFGPNNSLRWTSELHRFKGDLLFADGRVEERNAPGLVRSGTKPLIEADLALPTVQNGAAVKTLSRGSSSDSDNIASAGSALLPDSAAKRTAQNQAQNIRAELPPDPIRDIVISPGWSTGLSSKPSQPDAALAKASLQPGTNADVLIPNWTAGLSNGEDPGFSLFPPLLGEGGMLKSSGGHWVLIMLMLLLLIGVGILLKRRWAKSQLLRKAYRDIFQML